MKELGQLQGQEVQIVLEDVDPIFKQPYRLNEMERALVWAPTIKLLGASFMELLRGEYALTIVMIVEKDIFGN